MIFFKKLLPFILILMLTILAGCSSSSEGNGSKTSSKNNNEGKMITIGWPLDIGPLNPHTYLPNQMTAQAMVYESLVEYNDDGTISPKLAESWEISDDKTAYIFHLRQDVKYSDGTVFNADNVIRNFNAVLADRDTHSWMGMVNHIVDVVKEDDYTIRLQLDAPYYPVLNELAFVRPFRFLGDNGFHEGDATNKGIKAPVGTGPWVLTEYKKDQYALFSRNEHYWGEKPLVDKVKVKIIPDSESISLAFENEELDLIYGRGIISLDNYTFLKDSNQYKTAVSEPLSTRALLFNTQSGPLAELKVRQAIQYAVNKEQMVESITHGTEKVANTLFWDAIPYANIELKPILFNPEKAEQLLDEAGWTLKNGDKIRSKNGQPLTLDLIYIATDAIQKPMAELMQGELAKIGVQLKLEGADVMVGLQKLMDNQVDINFWRTNGPPTDPHSFANESATPNANGVYEAKLGLENATQIDDKIHQLLIGTDEAERVQLYKDILTMFHDQALFYPISYETNNVIYHKYLKDFNPRASEYDIPYAQMDVK
ncbi:nickel ABC transporter substrate-binding protein [Lysinibacillus sp. NPDC059133]|uniref:nickel ABC transporter substrate-binding protein n=1 Tax=Lysinibacillus sp. NPDC059133 TaxID=3346737 RepID=UPI00367C49CE